MLKFNGGHCYLKAVASPFFTSSFFYRVVLSLPCLLSGIVYIDIRIWGQLNSNITFCSGSQLDMSAQFYQNVGRLARISLSRARVNNSFSGNSLLKQQQIVLTQPCSNISTSKKNRETIAANVTPTTTDKVATETAPKKVALIEIIHVMLIPSRGRGGIQILTPVEPKS